MKPPAFQFYADDFLAGTLDMSQDEVGAYVRLLCHQWSRGSIPVEPDRQRRLAGGAVSAHVLSKFEAGPDGQLRNRRLEVEREKQDAFRENRAISGRKGAQSRWHSHNTAMAQPLTNGMANDSFPSPSPSPISSTLIPSSNVASAPVVDAPSTTQAKPEAPADLPGLDQTRSTYHPDARTALHILNLECGRVYREVDANLKIISARLREPGVTIDGVRQMIQRQCQLWKGTDYGKYLRPETLFRPSKFDGYYAARGEPVVRGGTNHRNDGLVGGVDPNKARRVLERRAAEAAAKATAGAPVAGQVAGPGVHLAGHSIAR